MLALCLGLMAAPSLSGFAALPFSGFAAAQGTHVAPSAAVIRAEWMARVDRHIKSRLPAKVLKTSKRGEHIGGRRAVLTADILTDGSIANIGVKESTGFPDTDRRFVKAFASLPKFAPIPKELGLSRVTITVPFSLGLG